MRNAKLFARSADTCAGCGKSLQVKQSAHLMACQDIATTSAGTKEGFLHALTARVTTLQAVRKSAASLMVIRSITGNYYKKQAPEHGKTRLASHAACCERHVHWSISQRIAQFRVKKEGAQIKKQPDKYHINICKSQLSGKYSDNVTEFE